MRQLRVDKRLIKTKAVVNHQTTCEKLKAVCVPNNLQIKAIVPQTNFEKLKQLFTDKRLVKLEQLLENKQLVNKSNCVSLNNLQKIETIMYRQTACKVRNNLCTA